MSINDLPEIREVFGRFRLEEVETTYTVGDRASRAAELLVAPH